MRPYCPAIRHFLDCQGNYKLSYNYRRGHKFMARWSERHPHYDGALVRADENRNFGTNISETKKGVKKKCINGM